MKSVVLFLVTFLVGAALAFATRTALHEPYATGNTEPPSFAQGSGGRGRLGTPAPTAPAPHAGHVSAVPSGNAEPPLGTSTAAATVVNTVCAICGMDVDPDIKPAAYQGQLVGFGCAACPPKFAKDPDRYGPSALRNEVAKN